MKWNDIKDVIKKELKESKLLEATLTADNTKFNIRTGVNKNPTKVGIKIQLEPSSGYLDPSVKDQLEVAIQEKLNTELADYDIQVSKDTDVPRDHVIGFFIPLSQLISLIVNKLVGKKPEKPKVTAPEPDPEPTPPETTPVAPETPTAPITKKTAIAEMTTQMLEEMRVRDLNEASKIVNKDDFYAFINAGNNIIRDFEKSGKTVQEAKKYIKYLTANNIM